MVTQSPREGSLVLYKGHPARVQRLGEKLDILLETGETVRVRLKDVDVLHPGPLASLADLKPQDGEVQAAWELLSGSQVTLPELADLIYGAYSPASAWATWQLVAEGLYFRGRPDAIAVADAKEVAARQASRTADALERQAWEGFLARMRGGRPLPEDSRYLHEVETLALGQSAHSRVLDALGYDETPESAHAVLLKVGYWTPATDPYPARMQVNMTVPADPWPPLPGEPRRDLTHLTALAIDDADTETPDDALSVEGSRLWVHVADPAAVVVPDSRLDREARGRSASLYLPEVTVPMLPPAATGVLGLGIQEVSPALSFGLDLDAGGALAAIEIVPSWLRVTRVTYEAAELLLAHEPLHTLYAIALANQRRRAAAGAVNLRLPEVGLRVRDGEVTLTPVPSLRSRIVVEEAMILAGEATAHFGADRGIPLPFATQEAADYRLGDMATLSEMFAVRRAMKPRRYQTAAGAHAGLGLASYVQVTSPLRRYLDLVAHQQLRAFLRGQPLLPVQDILERIGEVDAAGSGLRQAERLANQHWTLVYLLAHRGWEGEGVLVDKRGMSGVFLIPELGVEAHVHLPGDLPLDSRVRLALTAVDLPRLDARFRVVL